LPVVYTEIDVPAPIVRTVPSRIADTVDDEPAEQVATTRSRAPIAAAPVRPAPIQTPAVATQTPPAAQTPARIMVNGVAYAAVQAPAPAQVTAIRAPASVALPQVATAARPAAAMCDGLLANGCYLTKRKFSTAQGPELRCTVVCE
jgi:hypothetical protein